jgi:hypothetical protein
MRGKLTAFGLAGALLVSGISLSLLGTEATQAAPSTSATFLVPVNDGYGIGECAAANSTCGKVVADSWCEAQGYGHSESFGVADAADVTGALPGAAASDRPIAITCAQ